MTLKITCKDCDWETEWEGGPAADDPSIEHAKETGHTTRTVVKGS